MQKAMEKCVCQPKLAISHSNNAIKNDSCVGNGRDYSGSLECKWTCDQGRVTNFHKAIEEQRKSYIHALSIVCITGLVQVLECRVCDNVFGTQGDRIPRLLFCGHTLCHSCLLRLPTSSRVIQCPFDRQPTTLGKWTESGSDFEKPDRSVCV